MTPNWVSLFLSPQTITYGFSLTQASAGFFLVFTIGGTCNAGRAFLMRMFVRRVSIYPKNAALILFPGQQIVARLREQTNAATV
jgi:hypothetical protein